MYYSDILGRRSIFMPAYSYLFTARLSEVGKTRSAKTNFDFHVQTFDVVYAVDVLL